MVVPAVAVTALVLIAGRRTADRQAAMAAETTAQVEQLTAARNAIRELEGVAVAAYVKAPGATLTLQAKLKGAETAIAGLDAFDEPAERRGIATARRAFRSATDQLASVLAGKGGSPGPYPLIGFHGAIHTTDVTLGAVQRAALTEIRRESAATSDRQDRVTILAVVLLLLALATAALLARRLSRKLRAEVDPLREGARRIGDGDLTHRVAPLADQEFDALSQAFNTMADHVVAGRDELLHQAHHDALTGLPNRVLLNDRVAHAAARARRAPRTPRVGLLLLDIDGFKTLNDTLGHAAGDALLLAVAQRLESHVRPSDTVARLGGDEFAVLLEDVGDDATAAQAVRRVLEVLEEPLHAGGRDLQVTVSAGFAAADAIDATAECLSRNADLAMYRAKDHGKGRLAVFEPAMSRDVEQRVRTEQELGRAIAGGELELHHQLIVDLATGEAQGVEALVRWNHPERGMVPPMEFVPLAEESGLIVDLGRWVLERAVDELVELNAGRPAGRALYASVNVSARQLADPLFAPLVAAQAERLARPDLLVLELTERAFVGDFDTATAAIQALRALGVRIAIDDFGTGWSSLSYLGRLPIDILKIDRSFLAGSDPAIVDGIVWLARRLGLRTIAEGIEDDEQRATLQAMSCDAGQGYLFARPVPARELGAVLTAR